jgi:pimeloyl-ACP methyl ester carboxylesterase
VKTDDGVWLDGARYSPRPGVNRRREAIIFTHAAEGNFYQGIPFDLGRCLAERGFVTLCLNRRDHDGQFADSLFEDGQKDIKAAVDFLDSEPDIDGVFLWGHSLGSVFAAEYAASAHDERLHGLMLSGAIASYPEFRRSRARPEEYAQALVIAREAVEAGEPGRALFLRWSEGDRAELQAHWMPDGKQSLRPHTARQLLSYISDESVAVTETSIRSVRTHVLIMRSGADRTAPCQDSMRLFQNSMNASSATLIEFTDLIVGREGNQAPNSSRAGHNLSSLRPDIAAAAAQWVERVAAGDAGGAESACGGWPSKKNPTLCGERCQSSWSGVAIASADDCLASASCERPVDN